jgi:hypothetical protein
VKGPGMSDDVREKGTFRFKINIYIENIENIESIEADPK